MKKYLVLLFVIGLSLNIFAQNNESKTDSAKNEQLNAELLAKETLNAHGGDKFKNMKTLSVLGDVDVTVSTFNQALPATFATIFSGEKYRLEINSQVANFKQIFDGEQTLTLPKTGFNLPPVNRLGPPLLQRLGDEGFIVSALPDKKKTGFRITAPDGFYSDFFVDKKTKQIKGYESKYVVNNREVSTLVEINKLEDKDGILIPTKYAQRFELGQMTVYAEFKAKEIKINEEVSDKVFALE